jgi:hypothetical protein
MSLMTTNSAGSCAAVDVDVAVAGPAICMAANAIIAGKNDILLLVARIVYAFRAIPAMFRRLSQELAS